MDLREHVHLTENGLITSLRMDYLQPEKNKRDEIINKIVQNNSEFLLSLIEHGKELHLVSYRFTLMF